MKYNRPHYEIVGAKGLVRDKDSKGLVCVDPTELQKNKVRQAAKARQAEYETRLSNVENKLDSIENLLKQLVNK
jgi:hypothetical protein